MTANTDVSSAIVRSLIPARMDRLPWTRFHTRLVMSLGTAWILDGLEITLASSVAGILTASDTLRLSSAAVGAIATVYLVGQVVGALVFGRLSDALGRRKLFMVTLGVYLFGSGLTAATAGAGPGWVAFLYLTRFIAGAGIGGEYAAINSAIDEMIPARYRGRVDIGVNGTYWAGSIIGTLVSLAFLNWIGPVLGWRLAFLAGPALAVVIVHVRRTLPESPRWLLTHGHAAEAEQGIAGIEATVEQDLGRPLPPVDSSQAIEIRPAKFTGYRTLLKLAFTAYWRRAVLGATLLITQSFLYNAIFFTYALVLIKFYGVGATMAPVYLIAFAAGNLAGPLVLGRLYRHHRPQADDRRHLPGLRRHAHDQRVPVRPGGADRTHPDDRLVRDLLLRLGRGELGLPDRQRDLPGGNPRRGDRGVLRDRPGVRRGRADPVRGAHRRR